MPRQPLLLSLGVAALAVLAQLYVLHSNMQDLPRPEAAPRPAECPAFDPAAALDRFRAQLRFPTVSNASAADHTGDLEVFRAFVAALAAAHPLVWRRLEVEQVGAGGHSLLLTWRGSDPALPPVLFVSHYDVVPVTPGSEGDWPRPPWAGELADGYVWGRGAADIKFGVAGLLEAAGALLAAGWAPRRTLMMAFGHDEEVGGDLGAGATAALLAARRMALGAVVDEGGLVLPEGLAPFAPGRPVALVGTAEKGASTLRVTLRSAGGHASMPPTDGSDIGSQLGRLGAALALLPTPGGLAGPAAHMLRAAAPLAPPLLRPLLASCERGRSRLVNGLLHLAMRHAAGPTTAAMVASTAVLTRVEAGVADNVLPQEARLSYNVRVLPGVTPAAMARHVAAAAAWARVNASVELEEVGSWPASPVTDPAGRPFALLKRAIQETWDMGPGQPPLPVLPFLLSGGTDSKHYARLLAPPEAAGWGGGPADGGAVLRFVPYGLSRGAGGVGAIHGTGERVPGGDLARGVCTYARAMQLLGGGGAE